MPLAVGKLVLLSAVAALCTAVALWWTLRYSSIAVKREDIVRVAIEPHPQGPPLAIFGRNQSEPGSLPLDRVEEYIPIPLPAPTSQGGCHSGGSVVIEVANRASITYGPCSRPSSIGHLWAHMIEVRSNGTCRPRCGPEGEIIPLHRG